MDGLFISGRRPTSKKQVKEAVTTTPEKVRIESTSLYGGYDGSVSSAPDGSYHFVGPDPYTKRSFCGVITVKAGKVSVK